MHNPFRYSGLLRTALAPLCAVLALAGPAADARETAQQYPSRPIRLIVPFAPGGVTDTGARLVADKLGQRLGKQVIVDNKPGASGNIGTHMAAQAEPDGYTLVVGFDGTLVVNPHVHRNIPFDTLKDLAPVSKIGDAALIIVANPALPANTLQELIAYSKKEPNGVSYGSAGVGSTPHLAGELLSRQTGARFVHIPYKGGGQAMADVVGGTLPMLYTAVAGAYPYVQRGQIKAIAVSTEARLASLPDVPTVAESGVPGFVSNSWIGILAPAGTPDDIVNKLQHEIHAIVHTPETKERLAGLGITASGNAPDEFRRQIASDLAKYADIVKAANIQAD
ncbi:Bug family tripartite tricarboxylate transporter substrate binding protein [Parapusillimonas granuli]|uniref:Tripartite tricarboxylate transporter substrate binding protein n=1 Tax=Parapusillimonas granuli TaxID=380911 RepID=A0A853G3M4_9BURK|nr:tripartite tricarboxylate transporter substrate binding protein [Parapusillimonas granuli]MBB5215010.1 tripartite-type tricarboxylate transporter receptor subunit TctC [Parapusillimonas granuli]MEB2401136.1 tripartite tricarboxylate transporter substrate binding protein [Alcaligenaceae bacterium]NYT49331.1 tripartite tricarboxylate transporter substrate binding protein [Parapusillimonas granuli]